MEKHFRKLSYSFNDAPFSESALKLFEDVANSAQGDLATLSSASVKQLCKEVFPDNSPTFYDSRQFPRTSKSTQSLVDICKELKGTHYLTGLGAKNYIDKTNYCKQTN